MAPLGYEDVRGFDIAVYDSGRVRCIEGVGNLDSQRQDSFGSSGLAPMRCFNVTPSRNSMTMKG